MNETELRDALEKQRKALQTLEVQHKVLVKAKAELVRSHSELQHDHSALKKEHERLRTISLGLMMALEQFRDEATRIYALGALEETAEAAWIPEAMQFFAMMNDLFESSAHPLRPAALPPRASPRFKVKLKDEADEDGYVTEEVSAEDLEQLIEEKSSRVMEVMSAKG